MSTPVAIGAVTYPYSPSRIETIEEISGGSGGPVPDPSVPDGTPSEVKRRLEQILVQGAQSLLTYLQYKALPVSHASQSTTTHTSPNAPIITGTVGNTSDVPTIRITGQAKSITQAGLIGLAVVVGLAFLSTRRG